MTSISPARTELTKGAVAKALAATPAARPIMDMQEADNVQIHLMIEPGWVGLNKFTVILATPDGLPVTMRPLSFYVSKAKRKTWVKANCALRNIRGMCIE